MKMRTQRKLDRLSTKTPPTAQTLAPTWKDKPDGMYLQVEQITPDHAATLLEKNHPNNRPVKFATVKRYLNMMKADTWQLSPQGIVLDTEGYVIDGQHRLWAILESGVTVDMTVTYNAPHQSFGVLDQGKNRTVSDLSENKFVTQKIVAIARSMARGPVQSHVGFFDDRDPSLLLEFIEEHQPTIEGVLALMPGKNRRGRSHMVSAVLGALCRAYHYEDHGKLLRFIDVFTSGVTESEGERIIIVLRDYVKENYADKTTVYQKTQRAIKAYCSGDTIKNLYAIPDDLYPLPGKEARTKVRPEAIKKIERERKQRIGG